MGPKQQVAGRIMWWAGRQRWVSALIVANIRNIHACVAYIVAQGEVLPAKCVAQRLARLLEVQQHPLVLCAVR